MWYIVHPSPGYVLLINGVGDDLPFRVAKADDRDRRMDGTREKG